MFFRAGVPGICKIKSSGLFVDEVQANLKVQVMFWACVWAYSKKSSELFVDEDLSNPKAEIFFGADVSGITCKIKPSELFVDAVKAKLKVEVMFSFCFFNFSGKGHGLC